jgi:arabinofuranosyltransferase
MSRRSGNAPAVAQSDMDSAAFASAGRGPHEGSLDVLQGSQLRTLLLLFVLWVTLKNAWLCEDSFITFRVSDNLIHGLGPRWNPLERVQAYTSPLWMLAVSAVYFVSRDIYFSGIASSLLCSALAVWLLLFRGLRSAPTCLLAGVALTFSKAFIDYSTSGLENPLSHVLVLFFFIEYLRRDTTRSFSRMVWFAGFALVDRLDLVWLLLPPLVQLACDRGAWRWRHLRLWIGLSPLIAWELFSLVYYGFLVPNTAYAKLGTGVGTLKTLAQGGSYFVNSLSWDPLTLFTIAVVVFFSLRRWRDDRAAALVAVGILLQLAYVVMVGGDYMSGRLFTTPLVVALLLLSRIPFAGAPDLLVATGMLLALGISSPRPPVETNEKYQGLGSSPQDVDDERGYRHNDTALLLLNRNYNVAHLGGWVHDGIEARESGQRVTIYKNIGYYGFFAGPGVHVIDPYGLGDPLLARLPFDASHRWGPGHFLRPVPDGYPQAAVDEGQISEPEIAAYWAKIELVTRGPLLDRRRLAEIVRMNLLLDRAPRLSR